MKVVISVTEEVTIEDQTVTCAKLEGTYDIRCAHGKTYYNDSESHAVMYVDDAEDISTAVAAGDAKDVTDPADRTAADQVILDEAAARHNRHVREFRSA